MARLPGESAERLADYFVAYLFDQYRGARHVRRIASWVGLIVLGIERLAGRDWGIPRSRQLEFNYARMRFKAKYNHRAGRRGGIDIVEVLPGRGSPEGRTVTSITNLRAAEDFYNGAPRVFGEFLGGSRAAAG